MMYVQCHWSKHTAQLGSILQVCILQAKLVVLAVRCTFVSLNKHAEHARPMANKLCLLDELTEVKHQCDSLFPVYAHW